MPKAKNILKKYKKEKTQEVPEMVATTSCDYSLFIERINNILNDNEVLDTQKLAICAVIEGFLELYKIPYSYTKIDEFVRYYKIKN